MTKKFCEKKIREIESKYGISFGEIDFRLSDWRVTALAHRDGKNRFRISLPLGYGRREFLEDLLHELGHVFNWKFGIPQEQRALFQKARGRSKKNVRKPGFVSEYSETNSEEDFCETFSAFNANGWRTSGVITYGTERINLESDPVLKAKFKAVKILLSEARLTKERSKRARREPIETFDFEYEYRASDNFSTLRYIAESNQREIERIKKMNDEK